MEVSLFDFELPEHLIAQMPAEPRDAAQMLVVDTGLHDDKVGNLVSYLLPGDLLVFNDTKVIPVRLFGKRGKAKVELLLHRRSAADQWLAFARPAKKLKTGDQIEIAPDFLATVLSKTADGQVMIAFSVEPYTLPERLERHGIMPLPPYIKREKTGNATDKTHYQTIYAKNAGAVAAPTAGLHFTPKLLEAIRVKGIETAFVTLHVGAGTFQPVKASDTERHVMHSEWAEITQEAADSVNRARARGGRIVTVGTTSLRTLESAADEKGIMRPYRGDTNIFITPGYCFKIADILLTNFHLPRSTLFMLVSAFSGLERMQEAYAHAIARGYRFYSYGDACLLYRQDI